MFTLEWIFRKEKTKSLYEFSDIELIEIIAHWMDLTEYHVYKIACEEIGFTDEKEVDKSYERFYFPKSGKQILMPAIRSELRRAFMILSK